MTLPTIDLKMLAASLAALSLVATAACQNSAAREAQEARLPMLPGEAIAERLCSGCHAIGRNGSSPHSDALPFRQISTHYPVRDLEEALAEGIRVGHPDMPPFQLEPGDIDDLLDYIEAIQDPI